MAGCHASPSAVPEKKGLCTGGVFFDDPQHLRGFETLTESIELRSWLTP